MDKMRRTTPVTTKTPTFSSDDYKTAILSEFRGIDESVNPFNVVKNSAKEINNLYLDDEGTMVTRPRLEYVQKLSRIGVYFNTFKIFDKDKKWIWVMVYTKPYKIYVKVDENSPFVEYSLETTSAPYLYEMDSFGAIFDNEKNKYLIGSVGNVSKLYVVELNFTTKTMKLTPADAYIPTTKNYDISTDTEYTFEQANLWSPEVKWAAYWNPEYFNNEAFRERKYSVAENKYYTKVYDGHHEGYTFVSCITDYFKSAAICLFYKFDKTTGKYSAIVEYTNTSQNIQIKTTIENMKTQPRAVAYEPENNTVYLCGFTPYSNEVQHNQEERVKKNLDTGETQIAYSIGDNTPCNFENAYVYVGEYHVAFCFGYTETVAQKRAINKMSVCILDDVTTCTDSYPFTNSSKTPNVFSAKNFSIDSEHKLVWVFGDPSYPTSNNFIYTPYRLLFSDNANTCTASTSVTATTSLFGALTGEFVATSKDKLYFYSSDNIADSSDLPSHTCSATYNVPTWIYSSETYQANIPDKTTLFTIDGNLWAWLPDQDESYIWYGNILSDEKLKIINFNKYLIKTNVNPLWNNSIIVRDETGVFICKFDETSPKPLLFFAVNSAVDKPGHINRVDRYNNNFVFWSTETNTVYFTKNNDPTYIPEAYYDRYGGADGVKSVMRISDEYLAVLKENDTFLTWTSNDLFYSNELRTHTGSSKTDSSIVCNYSNLPIMINEDGVWSLGQSSSVNYQDTIYSSMTDQIDKSFTSISPDKYYLHNHKYYTYIGENNGDDCIMWVFDNRIGMWYKWTLPIRIAGFIEIDDVTYVVNEYGDRLYKLEINSKRLYPELDDTSYVDEIWSATTDSLYYRNIDWKWVSQPIYLNTLNYKKRMRYLKLIFANKYESDHITFKYWFKTYTQTEYPTNPKTYTAAIASLKTQKFRPHIPKFDFIQIILESNNSSDEFEDGEGNVVPTTLNDKIGFVSIALNYILLEG